MEIKPITAGEKAVWAAEYVRQIALNVRVTEACIHASCVIYDLREMLDVPQPEWSGSLAREYANQVLA